VSRRGERSRKGKDSLMFKRALTCPALSLKNASEEGITEE